MKFIIKRILREIHESEGNPLSKSEIYLFKYLNKHKKEYSTQSKMLNFIKTMLPLIGKDESMVRFYYEVYTANYRPDGDYENIDKSTFKDYRQFKQKKTPNNSAYNYSIAKVPFKGSNLEGYWDVNSKGEWYYVVESYGWYPIFLFINNKWYRVSNSYSSSTAKHLSYSNPVRWNSGLKADVITVTSEEIKNIRDGKDMSLIKSSRIDKFMERYSSQLKGTTKLISIGWGEDKKKVNYTITDIQSDGEKITFNVKINKAGKVVNNKMEVSPEGYIYPSPFSDDIEEGIKRRIISDNSDYLKDDNTEFIFNHPSKS